MALPKLSFVQRCIFLLSIVNTATGFSDSGFLAGEWNYGFLSGYVLSSLTDNTWKYGLQGKYNEEWTYGNVNENFSWIYGYQENTKWIYGFSMSHPDNHSTNKEWNYGLLPYIGNELCKDSWVYGKLNNNGSKSSCLLTCTREQCGYCRGCGPKTFCCECDNLTSSEETTPMTTAPVLNELTTTEASSTTITETLPTTTDTSTSEGTSEWSTTENDATDPAIPITVTLSPPPTADNNTDGWCYGYCLDSEWQYSYLPSSEWQYGSLEGNNWQYIESGFHNKDRKFCSSPENNEWMYGFSQISVADLQSSNDIKYQWCDICCHNESQSTNGICSWIYGHSAMFCNETKYCNVENVVSSYCHCTCCFQNTTSPESTTQELTTEYYTSTEGTTWSFSSSITDFTTETSSVETTTNITYATTETTTPVITTTNTSNPVTQFCINMCYYKMPCFLCDCLHNNTNEGSVIPEQVSGFCNDTKCNCACMDKALCFLDNHTDQEWQYGHLDDHNWQYGILKGIPFRCLHHNDFKPNESYFGETTWVYGFTNFSFSCEAAWENQSCTEWKYGYKKCDEKECFCYGFEEFVALSVLQTTESPESSTEDLSTEASTEEATTNWSSKGTSTPGTSSVEWSSASSYTSESTINWSSKETSSSEIVTDQSSTEQFITMKFSYAWTTTETSIMESKTNNWLSKGTSTSVEFTRKNTDQTEMTTITDTPLIEDAPTSASIISDSETTNAFENQVQGQEVQISTNIVIGLVVAVVLLIASILFICCLVKRCKAKTRVAPAEAFTV